MEDQVFGQAVGVAPYDPAHAREHEAVLVARGVDRHHAGNAEVPLEVRVQERSDEAAGGAVDVHRYVGAAAGREIVERLRDPGDILVAAVERRAEHGDDPDRVLIACRGSALRRQVQGVLVTGTSRGSTSQ